MKKQENTDLFSFGILKPSYEITSRARTTFAGNIGTCICKCVLYILYYIKLYNKLYYGIVVVYNGRSDSMPTLYGPDVGINA